MQICEMFRSIQGEGITQGKNSLFIRFPNCNLACQCCDSKFTWKDIEKKEYSDEEVFAQVKKVDNVVFTGGEPFLSRNLSDCIKIMTNGSFSYHTFEIETNGTILPDIETLDYLIRDEIVFNISPKINVKQERKVDTNPILVEELVYRNLKGWDAKFIVKFLFSSKKDLKIVEEFQKQYDVANSRIYMQPMAVTRNEVIGLTKLHFDEIIEKGWNISLREHVILFGKKRSI